MGQTAAVLAVAFAKKGDPLPRNPFRPEPPAPKVSEEEEAAANWEAFRAAMFAKYGRPAGA